MQSAGLVWVLKGALVARSLSNERRAVEIELVRQTGGGRARCRIKV